MTMIKTLRQNYIVIYATILSVLLLALRIYATNTFTYTFLLWNLWLATIPLLIALKVKQKQMKGWRLFFYSCLWLLFLPNAPYLITDILHISHLEGAPIWFDSLMLFTTAFIGLILAFQSMKIISESWHYFWETRWLIELPTVVQKRIGELIKLVVFIMTGLGIYIGRVLRWNSWDIVSNYKGIFADIFNRILHPFENTETWGFTFCYALAMWLMYNGWCKTFYGKRTDKSF